MKRGPAARCQQYPESLDDLAQIHCRHSDLQTQFGTPRSSTHKVLLFSLTRASYPFLPPLFCLQPPFLCSTVPLLFILPPLSSNDPLSLHLSPSSLTCG